MLQFVREIPVRIVIEKTLSSRRGFLFHLAAGFSKDIDPLSGMSVNLVEVDQWLHEIQQGFQEQIFENSADSLNESFKLVLTLAEKFLSQKARTVGAKLQSLTLREERGWIVNWDSSGEIVFRYPYFVEAFSYADNKFDMLKVEMNWQSAEDSEADYQHEGFKILKQVSHLPSIDLAKALSAAVGTTLPAGDRLESVTIHHLGDKYTVEYQ